MVAASPTTTLPSAVISVKPKAHKPLKLTFGSDPELMIQRRDSGRIVSSLAVLNGRTKKDPIDLGDGGAMYADNVLCEMRMLPAATSAEMVERFRAVFRKAQGVLGKQYRLLPQAAHVYDADQLGVSMRDPKTDEEKNPAWAIGCEPTFSAWTDTANEKLGFTDGLRTGSMHIHLGNANWLSDERGKLMTQTSKLMAIKLMDVFVGCAGVVFDQDTTAQSRRKLYGQMGEYRPTPYGCEYRCLGNWPLRSPETTGLVYDLAGYAMSHIDAGTGQTILDKIPMAAVQAAINLGDRTLAQSILVNAGLPDELLSRVTHPYSLPSFESAWGITV